MELYWAEGRYLPENLLASKDRYRRLIFYIPDKLADPATLNHDQIEEIRAFGSSESRETAPVSATSFLKQSMTHPREKMSSATLQKQCSSESK